MGAASKADGVEIMAKEFTKRDLENWTVVAAEETEMASKKLRGRDDERAWPIVSPERIWYRYSVFSQHPGISPGFAPRTSVDFDASDPSAAVDHARRAAQPAVGAEEEIWIEVYECYEWTSGDGIKRGSHRICKPVSVRGQNEDDGFSALRRAVDKAVELLRESDPGSALKLAAAARVSDDETARRVCEIAGVIEGGLADPANPAARDAWTVHDALADIRGIYSDKLTERVWADTE